MGDLTIPQVKFPMVGEDSVFKSPIPPSQHWFFLASLKHAVAQIKQVVKEVFTMKGKVKSKVKPSKSNR